MQEKNHQSHSIELADEYPKKQISTKSDLGSPSNYYSSLAALISNTIGVTVLQMPKLFYESGVVLGIAQIASIGLLSFLSGSVLCSAAKATHSRSYSELIPRVMGGWNTIPMIMFFLLVVGNIICYHTFVLKNLIQMVSFIFGLELQPGSSEFTSLVIGLTLWVHLMILPFLFSRKLKFVRIITSASTLAILMSVLVILATYIWPHLFGIAIPAMDWDRVELYKLDGLSVSIGYYLLSFCFHLSVIDIAQEMRPPSATAADKVLFSNCLIAVVVYILVSWTGYFTIYTDTELNRMTNYLTYLVVHKKNGSWLLCVANFFVLIGTTFANILNYVPLIKLAKSHFNKKSPNGTRTSLESLGQLPSPGELDSVTLKIQLDYRKNNKRIIWIIFIFTLLIHILLESFRVSLDIIFDFVGALCGPLVLLVLPGIIHLISTLTKKSSPGQNSVSTVSDMALGYFLISVGLFLWGIGLYEFGSV
jgi:amino acid permease